MIQCVVVPALSRLRRLLAGLAPKGPRDLLLQVSLLGGFEIAYALSGLYGRAHASVGVANAESLARFERTLGVFWEHGLQDWTLRGPHVFLDVANRAYFVTQFTISTIFLLWVYARHTERFARVRNALIAANYVSLVVLFAYPLAPPRMVPGSGFVDTLDQNGLNLHSSVINALNNPYSAMPSLHASYALVIGVAGVLLVRRPWARALWALYPALVTYSILATGNHFVLDVVAGAAALLATPLVDRAASGLARLRGCGRRVWPSPAAESERAW
jgi:membrane-associated phospholipid phosphatase